MTICWELINAQRYWSEADISKFKMKLPPKITFVLLPTASPDDSKTAVAASSDNIVGSSLMSSKSKGSGFP